MIGAVQGVWMSDVLPGFEGDDAVVAALRAGDEAAFTALVEGLQPSLLRIARLYVRNPSAAEEVVQETWLGVLKGLDRFEGRSSLKTWITRILLNTARTKAVREGRSLPFSAFGESATEPGEPAVDADRFDPASGHWTSAPSGWGTSPEDLALSSETRALIREAVEALPSSQREVITLRDIDGWTSEEVCNVLNLSETNQRVLLHRARSKVRRVIEQYLEKARG